MQVKKQQLEPDVEQQTGSKLGKEYVKAVYCHPTNLTSVPSTACNMSGWMKHRLEGDTTLIAQNEEEIKSLLKEKEDSEKAGLKLNIQKIKIMASGPITSWQ